MRDDFSLSIVYKGQQREYTAQLIQQGYSYKIVVFIDDLEVYFEPDEERNFRIIATAEQDQKKLEKLDQQLLAALHEKLAEILK
jgi:uncharacterized protein (DUF1499 family)